MLSRHFGGYLSQLLLQRNGQIVVSAHLLQTDCSLHAYFRMLCIARLDLSSYCMGGRVQPLGRTADYTTPRLVALPNILTPSQSYVLSTQPSAAAQTGSALSTCSTQIQTVPEGRHTVRENLNRTGVGQCEGTAAWCSEVRRGSVRARYRA